MAGSSYRAEPTRSAAGDGSVGRPTTTLPSNQFGRKVAEERPSVKPIEHDVPDMETEPIDTIPENYKDIREPIANITSLHLMDISTFPLLTHREEIDLAKRVESGQRAQEKLVTATGRAVRLRLEQEAADGLEAKSKLWESNCKLVVAVARKFVRKGLPLDDLIEEGNLGLERATTKFDWRKGFRFSTYTTWWIRQYIRRAIYNQARTIRIPVHTVELMNTLLKTADKLQQHNEAQPDANQIAQHLNVPVEIVTEAYRAYLPPISLEQLSDQYDGRRFDDILPGTDNVQEIYEQKALSYELRDNLLNILSDRERMVINLRYGLADGNIFTLSEIGLRLGVTRERVRQIEAAALRKLRTAGFRDLFTDYFES